MEQVVLRQSARTAVGAHDGGSKGLPAVELGAAVGRELLERTQGSSAWSDRPILHGPEQGA